jgi:hypothetical protein
MKGHRHGNDSNNQASVHGASACRGTEGCRLGRALRVVAVRSPGGAMSAALVREAAASPYRRQTPTLLQVIGQRVWSALEAVGRRRAARDLHEMALRWESIDPERARLLRTAAQFNTQENSQ